MTSLATGADDARALPDYAPVSRSALASRPQPVAGQHVHPLPGHDTLMFIDVVNAGRVPIYNLNLSEDVPGYMAAPATALDYPWTHFISGHVGRLATREDGSVHQKYIDDIEASARTTTFAIPESLRPDSGSRGPVHP